MASLSEQVSQTLEVTKELRIAAPIDMVFETVLEEMGPHNSKPDGTPMPMTIEPWPGGRWFRDFGNNTGHLWGHVQSIKPPTLLEFYGPLFMSSPVGSHVHYRLSEEGGFTLLKFSHRAAGQIPPEYSDGESVRKGWAHILERIREVAELRAKEGKK
jgi:uncharacterized protein YndB with AHSA1/START domain